MIAQRPKSLKGMCETSRAEETYKRVRRWNSMEWLWIILGIALVIWLLSRAGG